VKPIRHPGYLQWIRTLPCSVCRTTRAVEAAHTGPHGLGQKSSDLSAIPLCPSHHRKGFKGRKPQVSFPGGLRQRERAWWRRAGGSGSA
jgi:hypothetical protein